MSTKIIPFISSLCIPTITMAYVDTYWHKGYTEKYLSIGKKIISQPSVKSILDDIHKPIKQK